MSVTALPDADIDRAVDALAEPVDVRPPLLDRLFAMAQQLTSTPRRAAFTTAWCFAAVIAVFAALPTTVSVNTATGPARAECGLDTFLYGYPDAAVRDACRHAEAGRLALFVPAMAAVVAGIVAAAALAGRDRRRRTTLADLALWAVLACAALAAALALRPATAELSVDGTLATAHCGADTYFLGYPDQAVEHACGHAFAPHARVMVVAGFIGAVAAAALAASARRRGAFGGTASTARRTAPLVVAGAAALAAAALLWPVSVAVGRGPSAATARCGIDTVIAGHPDHAVEAACRARGGRRAAGAVGAVVIALTGIALYGVSRRDGSEVAS